MLADDRGLANHDARAVVDEEAAADLRAGMNIDAGGFMRDVGDQPGHDGNAEPVAARGRADGV